MGRNIGAKSLFRWDYTNAGLYLIRSKESLSNIMLRKTKNVNEETVKIFFWMNSWIRGKGKYVRFISKGEAMKQSSWKEGQKIGQENIAWGCWVALEDCLKVLDLHLY